jgi:SAM-dependent methyltransferase
MTIDAGLVLPRAAGQPTMLPGWLLQPLLRARSLDAILRRRAVDLVAKAAMDRHLPRQGLCLDIGAGFGHVMEAVLACAPQRRGIAVDPVWRPAGRLVRRLDRDAASRWRFLAADGMRLPLAAESVDAAWMAFVLHHVAYDQQWRLLDEAGRVLRPGGTFLLLEDTPASEEEWRVVERADRRLNVEAGHAPHCYRGPAEWRSVLSSRGFIVEAEIAFSRVFPRASLAPVPHRAFVCRKQAP